MALRKLTISDLEQQGIERLKQLEPSIDASVYGSFVTNLIRSAAYGIYPATLIAEDIFKDGFPQTASTDALDDYHGVQMDLPRIPATGSTGDIIVYGEIGQSVSLDTRFNFNGLTIQTTAAATIAERSTPIDIVTAQAGIVTVTTTEPHNLPVNGTVLVQIDIGGTVVEGNRTIIGVTETTFSYRISDQNPYAFGAGQAISNSVVMPAQTIQSGIGSNVLGSVTLSGDFAAFTTFAGLTGAADAESDDAYRARLLKKRSVLEGVFTADQIELAALRVAGNTRVWVTSPKDGVTGGTEGVAGYQPQAGQVCVYFVRDGDDPIFPTAPVIATTKQSIIDFGQKPADTDDSDIFVFAPLVANLNIGIANLVPDTPQMRLAIESALRGYIADYVEFEGGFSADQMRAVIAFTRDAAGRTPDSFDLLSTSVPAASGTLIAYDGVTWS